MLRASRRHRVFNAGLIKHVAAALLCLYVAAFMHHLSPALFHGHKGGESERCAFCTLLAPWSLPVLAFVLLLFTPLTLAPPVRHAHVHCFREWSSPTVRGPPLFLS